jgi:hypothetical protein
MACLDMEFPEFRKTSVQPIFRMTVTLLDVTVIFLIIHFVFFFGLAALALFNFTAS